MRNRRWVCLAQVVLASVVGGCSGTPGSSTSNSGGMTAIGGNAGAGAGQSNGAQAPPVAASTRAVWPIRAEQMRQVDIRSRWSHRHWGRKRQPAVPRIPAVPEYWWNQDRQAAQPRTGGTLTYRWNQDHRRRNGDWRHTGYRREPKRHWRPRSRQGVQDLRAVPLVPEARPSTGTMPKGWLYNERQQDLRRRRRGFGHAMDGSRRQRR